MPTDIVVNFDKKYLEPKEPLHIVGQEWQLQWFENEVEQVIKLWAGGYSLQTIALRMNATTTAVFLLLLDMAEQGRISKRIGYVWGCQ